MEKSSIVLVTVEENLHWILTQRSFEVVHGLSRVVRLVPDKLATALVINRENLPDPDDGGFLIKLVDDIVHVFIDRHRLVGLEDPEISGNVEVKVVSLGQPWITDHESADGGNGQDLSNLLSAISGKLQQLQQLLKERKQEEFRQESQQFVELCDDVLIASHVYLDLIHPVWIEVQRSGLFEDVKVEEKKVALLRKLERMSEKLSKEFREHSSEKTKDEE